MTANDTAASGLRFGFGVRVVARKATINLLDFVSLAAGLGHQKRGNGGGRKEALCWHCVCCCCCC